MEKVLVTGGTGFIGKQLVKLLLNNNYQVRIISRQKRASFPSEVELINVDITDPDTITTICKDVTHVFHLAGYAHAWKQKNTDYLKMHDEINFQGTKHLLKEAINHRVKSFIYFSSVKAVAESEITVNEDWETFPNCPYGIAKRKAERLVLNAKTTEMHVCILRPALVYGPEWKGNLESMLRAIDKGRFPPIPPVNNIRSMISINDLCQAALLVLTNPLANGKIYFVTDGIAYSTRQIYTSMMKALGKSVPAWHVPLWLFKLMAKIGDITYKITGKNIPFDSETLSKLFGSAHYDSSRIQTELSFKPIYTFDSALPNIIKFYQLNKYETP